MGHRYTMQSGATEEGGMKDESSYSELKELKVGNSDSLCNQYKPGVSFIAYGTWINSAIRHHMKDESSYTELKELKVGNSDSLFNQYKPGVPFIAYGTWINSAIRGQRGGTYGRRKFLLRTQRIKSRLLC